MCSGAAFNLIFDNIMYRKLYHKKLHLYTSVEMHRARLHTQVPTMHNQWPIMPN